ncbi:MAG: lipid-A-disaccharide synthase [Pseudomonadota bacterium]
MLRVAIVAGESSGDLLGARVMGALRAALPDVEFRFEGVGGDAMLKQGMESFFPMERLAVMGLVEPLGRLPELLGRRRALVARWRRNPPAFFLGVDAPDFNLGLARRLKSLGVPTVHLVSPTVWAWRPGRVSVVANACNQLLCLFPFEPAYYSQTGLKAHFVGHPIASLLEQADGRSEARASFGLADSDTVFALLPGSRHSEVSQLFPDFVRAASLLQQRDPTRKVLIPAASVQRRQQLGGLLKQSSVTADLRLVDGHSHQVMLASDVVITASGTASLEAMLLKRPMVIGYRLAALSWMLLSRLLVTKYAGLPNILAGRPVVPELLQDSLTGPHLALEAERLLAEGDQQVASLARCREDLSLNFDEAVVTALQPMIEGMSQ